MFSVYVLMPKKSCKFIVNARNNQKWMQLEN